MRVRTPIPPESSHSNPTDGTDASSAEMGPRLWCAIIIVTFAIVCVRVALIPSSPENTFGYSHDSAYITIVARNVLNGRGLVNDASWLVFLNPATLPMPFHNVNPLYPIAIAWVAGLIGVNVEYAGFLLSAISISLVPLVCFALLIRLGIQPRMALFPALAPALTPGLTEVSMTFLPDALATVLSLSFFACIIRMESYRHAALAGLFLGISWLTRSTAVLLLPAAFIYIFLTSNWRRAFNRVVVIGVAAGVVALPWLVYTARTWGSPFRSDSAYYLFENYYARAFGGSVEQYYHSVSLPPPVFHLLKTDLLGVLSYMVRGAPLVVYHLCKGLSSSSLSLAVAIGASTLFLVLLLRRRMAPQIPFVSLALFGATCVAVYAIRGSSFEYRYAAPLTALLAVVLGLGTTSAIIEVRNPTSGRKGLAAWATLACLSVWVLFAVKSFDVYRGYKAEDHQLVAYRDLAREVNDLYGTGRPIVVGTKPYFYTAATGNPSLSIPLSNGDFLVSYMQRYGASFILLTEKELTFWRPAWQMSASLPPGLVLVARPRSAYLFKLRRSS